MRETSIPDFFKRRLAKRTAARPSAVAQFFLIFVLFEMRFDTFFARCIELCLNKSLTALQTLPSREQSKRRMNTVEKGKKSGISDHLARTPKIRA